MMACVKQLMTALQADGLAEGPFVAKGLPICKASGRVLSDATTGLDCCHGVSRMCRSGTSRSPWGKPVSPPPGLEQDEGGSS